MNPGSIWARTQGPRFAASAAMFYGGTAMAMYGMMRGQDRSSEMQDRLGSRVGSSFAGAAFTAFRAGSPLGAAMFAAHAAPFVPAMARRAANTVGNLFGSVE
ncbi:MAG: hypothetical protein KGJ32_01495 [Xanthomonadaceae bacterium]|nr:hypothetical protein [Xanthomonadaceae bacterium]